MSQNELIIEHLKRYRNITQKEALEKYGIMRLGARIFEMRKGGLAIETANKRVVNRFGKVCYVTEYTLQEQA